MLEQVRYDEYGQPFGIPEGDVDGNGTHDSSDNTQIQTWIEMTCGDFVDARLLGLNKAHVTLRLSPFAVIRFHCGPLTWSKGSSCSRV